jgi:hypothetical protein
MTKHEREHALAAMAEGCMEPEFYTGPWVEIDSVHGSVHCPDNGYISAPEFYEGPWVEVDSDGEYRSDDPTAAVKRHRHGVLCRLSAPGYLDCTEWTACKTRVEAEEFLIETYGD